MRKICPKCDKFRKMSRHHVFPVRFYGRKHNKRTIDLCRLCHNKLEALIPFHEMPKKFYIRVVEEFLGGKDEIQRPGFKRIQVRLQNPD